MRPLPLSVPHAHFFGIELGARDAEHLEALRTVIPAAASLRFRTRDTNFTRSHESGVLTVCDLRLREELVQLGLPEGPKSRIIAPPSVCRPHVPTTSAA